MKNTHEENLRIVEAVLFAASEPLDEATIAERLPEGVEISPLLEELKEFYAQRGVNLVQIGNKYSLRTPSDLSFTLQKDIVQPRRLSRAALETLAIIAYHQPVTRAEIEDIRGVSVSKGTLDVLLESSWVRIRGRRRQPGRPVTYGTSDGFLSYFGLEGLDHLPGFDELKAAGLLDAQLPKDFEVPNPSDELAEDEDAYDPSEGEEEELWQE